MNNEFSWFDEASLRYFVSLLRKFPNYALSKHLPSLSENWYREILGCLERLQLPYYKSNYERLASLFYNIIKNHHFVDGNKRSAVIVLAGLIMFNGNEMHISSEGIRRLSKFIASSAPGDKEEMVDYLAKTLSWSIDSEI